MRCSICGKEISKSIYTNAVLCGSECYRINYWNEKVKAKDQLIIVDGECFWDGGDNKSVGSYRGFDGCRFWIEFFDGRKITTNNLWDNGTIPETHRELLPNNAKFISEAEYNA